MSTLGKDVMTIKSENIEVPELLQVCLTDFGFCSMTAEEFMQLGIDEFNQSVIKACRAGAAFWAAQEALKNTESAAADSGIFIAWIEKTDLTKQRVYECIKLARTFARLPPNKRQQYLRTGKKTGTITGQSAAGCH